MADFNEIYAKVKAGKYTFADSNAAGSAEEESGSRFEKIHADVKAGKYTFAGGVSPLEEDHLGAYQAKKAAGGTLSVPAGLAARNPDAVQADLNALELQIKRQEEQDRIAREKQYQEQQSQKPWYEVLAGYLGGVQDTTLPTSTISTAGTVKESAEMQALREKEKKLQEELEWSEYYQYAKLAANPDFAEKSQYKSTKNGRSRSAMDIAAGVYYDDGESGWDDPLYEYINGVKEAGAYLSNKAAAGYGDNALGRILARMSDANSESQYMSKDEVSIYNYIRATKGKEAAKEYYLYLQEKLNGEQRKALENKMKEWAQKDPVGSSAFSVLASPLKGISYVGQAADYLADGTMEKNAGYNAFSYGTGAIRAGVAEQIEKSGKWGKVGSFAYQTGMSMADFLMNTAISGGNGTLSMMIMGSGAAADTTLAAKDRGLSDGQAFALGTIAGAAEAVTERFSLEALLKPGLSKTALTYILKNALTEGSEEGASTLINTMADIIISKDKSEWARSVQAYKDAGKSEEEAFGLALADQAIALGLDVLGGMLSGTAMGSGGAVINHVGAVQTGKDIGKTNPDMAQIQSMIQEGLSNDPSTRSNYVAQQLQQKLLRGEKLTNTDLGKLHQANLQVAEVNRGTNMEASLKTQDFQTIGNDAVQAEDIHQQAQRLSEVLGREIVLYTEDATENGIHNGYYENGKIYVNTKSTDPFAQIVSHELTHSVEFADAYAELSQVVLGRIAAGGTDLNQLRQQKAALYAANNATLRDNSEIDKEIVADYIARQLLTDEKSIVELVRERPSLGRRILNWLNNLLAKLGNKNAQEQVFLSKTRDLYAKALGQSQTSFTEDTRKTAPVAENAGRQVPMNPELAEMLVWMRKEYADGNMTEEEFDSMLDSIMEYEERNNAAEPPEVQHSFSSGTVRKEDVASDLRAILNRGGGAEELRQYIAKMEQNTQDAYQNTGFAERNAFHAEENADEAEQIVKAARNQGIDVEEYLQQNWEQYDVDGQWNEAARRALDMTSGRRQYSITEPFVDNNGTQFDSAVLLDTEFFDGLNPRNWGSKLRDFVEMRAETDPFILPVTDENGNVQQLQFASTHDRAARNGGAEHKVLNELATGNDNISKLAVIHIDEIMDVADDSNPYYSADNAHGWLDQNGWLHRTANVINAKNGNIYNLTVDIAKARDGRHILYATKGKINRVGNANVSSLKIRGSKQNSNSKGSVTQTDPTVKRKDLEYQYAVSRGDMQTAQRMVDEAAKAAGYTIEAYHGTSAEFTEFKKGNKRTRGSLNFGDGFYFSPDRSMAENYTNTGRVISARLKLQNPYTVYGARFDRFDFNQMSLQFGEEVTVENVADVLQKNGYDGIVARSYNGTTNPVNQYIVFDANRIKSTEPVTYDDNGNVIALSQRFDAAKNDIRYSISGNPETEVAGETEQPEIDGAKLRAEMPGKARDYLKGVERKMLNDLAGKLCVPYSAKREYLLPIVEEISNEYLHNGMVSEQAARRLFDKAYDLGVVIDTEYYDQYKDIKDHMRTVAVTISDTDKADIADFADFKKRARGLLRIVNEGGMPVDSYYRELREMAQELFPDYITHPADQLQKMYKVAGDIRRVEKTLQEYYGKEADAFRRWAQSDFNAAIADFGSELQTVKRYAEEKTAERETKVPLTPQEAMGVYAQLKDARRNYEKVLAKNLLREHDEAILGDLLAGKRTLESLDPEEDNVKGITAVYEAKRELMQYTQLIAQYKRSLHKAHRDLADQHLETANEWKDKKVGIAYSRETMRRNVQDIVKDSKVAAEVNKTFFEPVAMAEAAATRFKEQYREKVRELNLSRKVRKGNAVSEAHAVQLLGEAMDNIAMIERARGRMKTRDGKTLTEWQAVITDLWKESPSLDRQKIEGAVDAFRKIYDELFVRMNEVRVANGYEPVNYRKGYFPHFQPGESDGILAHFGKALGISTDVVALPTTINGLTHTFKPGIQWFGNAQERLGFNTAYDAIEGFDKYIEGVASVIHQTENIQRLRALATQIRYRTSDDGLRDQVDQVRAREDLTEEQREALVADIYSKGRFTLSNFVVELDEYTNLLANKKSKYDRGFEARWGRKAYTFMKWLEGQVGANMIAGNISSALTNFIPLTQAGAQLDRGTLMKGMWETLRAIKQSDLLAERSDFITNRRGSDPLVRTWVQKASNVAGKPMELIDSFVSESIVRAAYHQNLQRGMMEEDALHYADIFAANVMADRSKGAMPTMFEAHNPLNKLFTQFQLEVNNQFSEVFKDLPRGFKEKGLGALALVLFKYFLGAWLYNEVFEYLFGRRSALDPIGILNETVGDVVGYELPNLLELMGGAFTGEVPSFETEQIGVGGAVGNLTKNVLEELPFASLTTTAMTLAGIETDAGRVPVASAVPNIPKVWQAATAENWSAEKRWKEASDELAKPLTYILPPFGGNQAAKMWKGLQAYFKGGSYSVDSEGNDILQYPVYKDDSKDAIGNLLRSVLMGKNSLPEAQDWVDSGFDSLSAKQTAAYKDMLDAGVNDRAAFLLLDQLQAAAKRARNQGENVAAEQRKILRMPYVTKEGKAIAYYGLMASEAEREVMDRLEAAGADVGEIVDAFMAIKDADATKGIEKLEELFNSGVEIENAAELQEQMAELEPEEGKVQVSDAQRWRLCVDMSRNPAVQLAALATYMQPKQYKKAEVASHFGIDLKDYVKLYEIRAEYDVNGNKSYSQAEYKAAIDSLKLSDEYSGILWQLATGAKSAKNNPYSKKAGEMVLRVLE